MAIINAIAIGKSKGSLGNMTLRYVSGATIGSQKVLKKGAGGTVKQVRIRARWGNLVNLYQAFAGGLEKGFEDRPARVSDFNMFLKKNIMKSDVYLTKSEVTQGGAVVFPAIISTGSLPSIAHTSGTGDVIVTDINLGGLTIGTSTTLKAFSDAVVNNNNDYAYGDQISAFVVTQLVNAQTAVPYVSVRKVEVTLSATDEDTLVRDIAPADVFAVVDNHLGMGATVNGGVAYVHSRKSNASPNGLQVSTQELNVESSILPNYTNATQIAHALESYKASSDAPFLMPNIDDVVAPVTP